MARDLLRLKLSQDMDTEVMVMVEVMEDMVDTEAMEDMAMARDLLRLKLRLSQDMVIDHMVMVVMAMEEDMEVMEDMDTEDTDMESKMLFHELITKEVSFCQLVFPNSIISIITAFLIVSNSK